MSRLQLSVRAVDLKNRAKFFRGISDPYAELTVSGGEHVGVTIGRTETYVEKRSTDSRAWLGHRRSRKIEGDTDQIGGGRFIPAPSRTHVLPSDCPSNPLRCLLPSSRPDAIRLFPFLFARAQAQGLAIPHLDRKVHHRFS